MDVRRRGKGAALSSSESLGFEGGQGRHSHWRGAAAPTTLPVNRMPLPEQPRALHPHPQHRSGVIRRALIPVCRGGARRRLLEPLHLSGGHGCRLCRQCQRCAGQSRHPTRFRRDESLGNKVRTASVRRPRDRRVRPIRAAPTTSVDGLRDMKALALEKRTSSSVELEIPLHIGPRDVKNCMHRGQNTAFRCGTQIMAEQLLGYGCAS